jgi:hypothetical protein
LVGIYEDDMSLWVLSRIVILRGKSIADYRKGGREDRGKVESRKRKTRGGRKV